MSLTGLHLRRRASARVQTVLRTPPAHAVTRAGPEVPTALPVDAIWREVAALYRTGLHPAIGLCLRHRGEVVLDRTIGHVEHEPGRAPGAVATPDTPFNLFSASKILTAMVIHGLVEDGLLQLDQPIAEILPELQGGGRDRIRVRHLLDHTAGIPDMPPGLDIPAMLQAGHLPREVLGRIQLASEPGTRVAYHPVSSWMILEAAANELTGLDLRTLARKRLLDPAGLTHLGFGVPAHRVREVAKHAHTGLPTPALMSSIFERTIGCDLDTAVKLSNHPDFLTGILPSANAIGTGREVTRLLQLLLNEGSLDGRRVLEPATVRRALDHTTPLRLDGTFGFPMRYGLGVMRGGSAFSLFGLDTPHAFGHLGFTNVVVYADPSRHLAVSFLNTGKPMLAPGMVQWYRVLQTLSRTVPQSDDWRSDP